MICRSSSQKKKSLAVLLKVCQKFCIHNHSNYLANMSAVKSAASLLAVLLKFAPFDMQYFLITLVRKVNIFENRHGESGYYLKYVHC